MAFDDIKHLQQAPAKQLGFSPLAVVLLRQGLLQQAEYLKPVSRCAGTLAGMPADQPDNPAHALFDLQVLTPVLSRREFVLCSDRHREPGSGALHRIQESAMETMISAPDRFSGNHFFFLSDVFFSAWNDPHSDCLKYQP